MFAKHLVKETTLPCTCGWFTFTVIHCHLLSLSFIAIHCNSLAFKVIHCRSLSFIVIRGSCAGHRSGNKCVYIHTIPYHVIPHHTITYHSIPSQSTMQSVLRIAQGTAGDVFRLHAFDSAKKQFQLIEALFKTPLRPWQNTWPSTGNEWDACQGTEEVEGLDWKLEIPATLRHDSMAIKDGEGLGWWGSLRKPQNISSAMSRLLSRTDSSQSTTGWTYKYIQGILNFKSHVLNHVSSVLILLHIVLSETAALWLPGQSYSTRSRRHRHSSTQK